jgi:hypothetical protein
MTSMPAGPVVGDTSPLESFMSIPTTTVPVHVVTLVVKCELDWAPNTIALGEPGHAGSREAQIRMTRSVTVILIFIPAAGPVGVSIVSLTIGIAVAVRIGHGATRR